MRRSVLLAAAIVVGLPANPAMAAAGNAKKPAVHRQTASAAHEHNRIVRHRTAAHRLVEGARAYGVPPFYAAPPGVPVYHRPGYSYVRGKGIVDEACNLPTSRCSNEYRDIQ